MSFYLPPQRLLCLLLSVVLMISILPTIGFANSITLQEDIPDGVADQFIEGMKSQFDNDPDSFRQSTYETFGKTYQDAMANYNTYLDTNLGLSNYSGPNTDYFREQIRIFLTSVYGWTGSEDIPAEEMEKLLKEFQASGIPHVHAWMATSNRTHHFYRCTSGCGARKAERLHNRDGVNGSCTCGHTYLSNCGLTTLHFYDMTLSPAFDPEITEYTATPVSYRPNLEKTRITAFKFDALSTVALPADLTVTPGKVFEITVTAEDQVTVKTYTVTVAE